MVRMKPRYRWNSYRGVWMKQFTLWGSIASHRAFAPYLRPGK